MTALPVLLFAVAVAAGVYEARLEATFLTRAITTVVLLGLSNLLACGPFFTADQSTWARTFVTGLFQTGLISLIVHVAPFLLAYHITRYVWRA